MAANTFSLDLELDLTQGAVKTGVTAALKITGDLTIQDWLNFESLPANTVRATIVTVVNESTGVSPYQFFLYNNGGSYELSFLHDNGTNAETVLVTWTPSLATWYHVAVVVTGSTVKFYINTIQQGSDQTLSFSRAATGTQDISVGIYSGTTPTIRMYDGLIDELAIYNAALASFSTQVDHTGETNLQGYWKFNNDYVDVTGANNLTGINTPSFSTTVPFANYGGSSGGYLGGKYY